MTSAPEGPVVGADPNRSGLSPAVHQWLILGAALFLTALLLVSHPPYSDPRDYIGYALRVTAWLSFSFFIIAYVARPLTQLFDAGWRRQLGDYAVAQRRYFGLGAAFIHTVHFGYVVVFLLSPGGGTDLLVLLFGGGAFPVLWAMAITSNRRAMLALGPRWKLLHRVGMHYLWFIFTFTLFGRVGLSLVSSLLFALALFAALLRFAASRR